METGQPAWQPEEFSSSRARSSPRAPFLCRETYFSKLKYLLDFNKLKHLKQKKAPW